MKIIVTGGAGFIASHVVDSLIAIDHEVIVVDDLSTGRRENVNPAARFEQLDVRSEEMQTLINDEKPDIINHHAAQMDVRRAVRDPAYDASVNVIGGLNILEAARQAGVRKLLFASTGGAVYGEPKHLPATEDTPIAPLSPYGLTKFTFENYLLLYRRLYGLAFTAMRYPNVYGPRQDPAGEAGVVAIFSRQMIRGEKPIIFGDGAKTRDYVHVSDIAKANTALMEQDHGEILNLGWGIEISDREIYDRVAESLGFKEKPLFAPVRPGEVSRICLDATKIRELIGWTPAVRFVEGVTSTAHWYRHNS